jgi:hypothetical protein
LYFQVTKATTLYQFQVYNAGSYFINLYKITNPSDWSTATLVWTTPYKNPAPNPDTVNVTLNLSVGTYMMLKIGSIKISSGTTPSFPLVSTAGITVNGSFNVPDLVDNWWEGSVHTDYWSSFYNLRACLQGL